MAESFDVIVIGGGVNGTGVARDAALRDMSVLLVEKNDFSAGTTWASSGMIHGGVRYLMHDIQTTKHSCTDSGYIQKIAPHLLFRIPFLMPVMKGKNELLSKLKLEAVKTFFEAYDRFQPLKRGKPSLKFSPEELRRIEPLIKADVVGAASIDEWGIDAPRLCLLNALDAKAHGATVHNHAEVIEILRNGKQVRGIKYRTHDGSIHTAYGRIVINTGGPWAPRIAKMAGATVRLRPAKGIHIIFPGRVSNFAVIVETVDGRSVFLMPHENISMLGTTDDDFYGDPDDIPVLLDEVRYLFQAISQVMPDVLNMRPMRVIAGIRPTLFEWGKYEDDLTREHAVIDHEKSEGISGFISLVGGKLASYRLMAEETVDVAAEKLGIHAKCRTHELPLPGGDTTPNPAELAKEYEVPIAVARRLVFRHGSKANEVLELAASNKRYRRIICRSEPVIEAEIRYAIRNEMALTIDDLTRRTRLGDGPLQGRDSVYQAGVILGEELDLSPKEVLELVRSWFARRWREQHAVLKGSVAHAQMLQASIADVLNPPNIARR